MITIQQIRWGGDDCFTHMLVVGPTRCGKTATLLKPMIYQLLLAKKQGMPLGLSVVEPKGDMAQMVYEMASEMGMPCVHVDPNKADSDRFPVMKGDEDDVAEATVVVLKSMFGKQEAFFATIQELAGRNITKLLKRLYKNDVDLSDVLRAMRDPAILEEKVAELHLWEGESDLVQFFRSELLGTQKEKYQQFVIGLRAQLENLTSNRHLEPILLGQSDFDIDKHFKEGGILAVNTAMGKLRKAGDAFGQFVVMHLQSGTFRRPGTEKTRIPHFMIIDEYSRYINPDVELFLSIAAEYRVAGIFAIQSLGQLEVESGKINARAMKQSILTSCRNQIAFGGLSAQDAMDFSREFGKKSVIKRESTFKQQTIIPNILPESYRDSEKDEDRVSYSQLMYGMPRFHYIIKMLENGTPMPPKIGKGSFVPRDWRKKTSPHNSRWLKLKDRKIRANSLEFVAKENARFQIMCRLADELMFDYPVSEDDHAWWQEIAAQDVEPTIEKIGKEQNESPEHFQWLLNEIEKVQQTSEEVEIVNEKEAIKEADSSFEGDIDEFE